MPAVKAFDVSPYVPRSSAIRPGRLTARVLCLDLEEIEGPVARPLRLLRGSDCAPPLKMGIACSTLARRASEGKSFAFPRLRVGLVLDGAHSRLAYYFRPFSSTTAFILAV